MVEIKVWVLTGVVVISSSIIGYIVSKGVSVIVALLSSIRDEIAQLNMNQVADRKDIEYLKHNDQRQDDRLDKHEERISNVERGQNNRP